MRYQSIMPLQWITFGDYREAMSRIRDAGIPIMVMVQSVQEAVEAATLGASAIVAQVICPMFSQAFLALSRIRVTSAF